MFVIVDLSDERNRRFEKYRKHPLTVRRCDVMGCAPFFTVDGHGKYFDREELRKVISGYGSAIFRNGKVPEGFEDCVFLPSVLPLRMLVKSASEFFREQPKRKRNMKICIFDKYAHASEEAAELSEFVRFVRVVTDRADLYHAAEREAYEKFGAVITSGSSAGLSGGCDCVIALNDSEFIPESAEFSLVFSKNSASDRVYAVREKPEPPQKFEDKLNGIDPYEFYCALFETCGMRIGEISAFNDVKTVLDKRFA